MTAPKDDGVDMSPDAIARRLAEVSALNRLCRYLGQFRPSAAATEQPAKRGAR